MTGRKGKRMFRKMLRNAGILIRVIGDWEQLNSRLRVLERSLDLAYRHYLDGLYQCKADGTCDVSAPRLGEARKIIAAEEYGIQATKVNR